MLTAAANGQTLITGKVLDNKTKEPLHAARIRNIHSSSSAVTDSNGSFSIQIKTGELLIIDKQGYENASIRISNENNPKYYSLHLDKSVPPLDVRGHLLPYQRDSANYYETYSTILNGSKKGDNYARESGNISLDALSKQNRERWAFQAMYEKWQNEKYIDFVFNKELVSKITFLEGEDLRQFMQLYRPSYSFLRAASDYEYLEYIKKSYFKFKLRPKY